MPFSSGRVFFELPAWHLKLELYISLVTDLTCNRFTMTPSSSVSAVFGMSLSLTNQDTFGGGFPVTKRKNRIIIRQ